MRLLYILLSAGLLGWGLTGLVLVNAQRSQRLAAPTDRGLHSVPTPVGGGLGMLAAAFIIFLIACPLPAGLGWILLAAVGLLGFISWVDDRQPLSPPVRLAAQALAVAGVLWGVPDQLRLVPGLPILLERLIIGLAWIWLINLTNFMDGIDGIAGVEAVSVGAGYALVAHFMTDTVPLMGFLPEFALMLAAAALGYLVWNWHPARIFMGDVGAIPLGLLFGIFMLDLAYRGKWAAALILPMYFIADASLTLLERLRKGAKPWDAHREHAYQRAVLAGMSHSAVTTHVAVLNCALAALAVLSLNAAWIALAFAIVITLVLRAWLHGRKPAKR